MVIYVILTLTFFRYFEITQDVRATDAGPGRLSDTPIPPASTHGFNKLTTLSNLPHSHCDCRGHRRQRRRVT